MHGDLVLRHVGLWDCGEELKVQLFDFGNAEEKDYVEGKLTKCERK